jgi:hypothetical protein
MTFATLIGLIPLIAVIAFDMQNVLSWDGRRVLKPQADEECNDYTLLIPLYGHPRYFSEENQQGLAQYKDHVVVICDVGTDAMVEGADRLESDGWRVHRCRFEIPTAPLLMKSALDGGAVKSQYVIRLDADTYVPPGLGHAVAAVRADGADLCSTKCHVANRVNFVTKMQAQEYKMAMLSRHYRPWMLSGACYIAKTTAAKAILAQHTLWFLAEDSEAGRIAWQRKMRIRHLDFRVYTDAPDTWRGLARQRGKIWWAGNFRHIAVNFDHNVLKMPVWVGYYAALVWVGLTWKWAAMITLFEYWPRGLAFLLLLFGLYTLATFASNWQVRSRYMWLIPYYSLIQSLLFPPLGVFFYARYAYQQKKLGRYRFPYRRAYPLPDMRLPTKEIASL